MVDAISQAAEMFSRDMNGTGTGKTQPSPVRGAPESIFGQSDNIEKDIPQGGGDNEPAPGEKQKKPSKREEDYIDPDLEDEEDEDADEGDDEEDEEDEDADEGDDEDGDDDTDEGDKDPILSKKYDIVVDGEEVTVSLREALKGYSREKTFHKRMNQIDEVAQTLSAEVQKTIDAQKALGEQYDEFAKQYDSLLPPEPNWDELYKQDPAKARSQEKAYQALKAKVQGYRDEAKKHKEAAEKAAAEEFGRFARAEFPKFARIARLKDEKHADRELKAMKKSALAAGFSAEEFDQAVDSRMLTILWKASRLDRLIESKPREVRSSRTQTDTNGAARRNGAAPTGGKGAGANRPRLPSTGGQHMTSIERAASVFEQHIRATPRGKRRG